VRFSMAATRLVGLFCQPRAFQDFTEAGFVALCRIGSAHSYRHRMPPDRRRTCRLGRQSWIKGVA